MNTASTRRTTAKRGRVSRIALWASALLVPLVVLAITACGADPTATPVPPTATPVPPTATPVPAQQPEQPAEPTATPTPDAMMEFKSEWEELIAAAQEEGELVVILGGSASRAFRPVVEEFGKRFNINAIPAAGRDGEHVDRILAERAAGKYLVDATHLGPTTSRTRAIPAGLFDDIHPHLIHPEVTNLDNWFKGRLWFADETEKYLLTHSAGISSVVTGYYNTDLVSQEDVDAIQSVYDYLDPKWKGTIVSYPLDIAGAGGTWYGIYVHPEVGPDWIDTFVNEMDVEYTPEARVIADGVATGKWAWGIAIGAAGRDIRGLAGEGLPVAELSKLLSEAPTLSGSGSSNNTAIFTQPANPNAAKLYINWFLSKEGQTVMHEMSDIPPAPTLRVDDVPWGKTLEEERRVPGQDYYFLSADPEYLARHDEAIAYSRGVYAAATGQQ